MGKLNRDKNNQEKEEGQDNLSSKKPSQKLSEDPKKKIIKEQSKNNVIQLAVDNNKKTTGKLNRQGNDQNQPKNDPKKKVKDEKTDENALKNDEYKQELEWREKEVARVFREGRNRGGRPTKLNESVMRDAEVLAHIGLSENAIAQSLMVSERTLKNWIKKNKEFFTRIKRAREKGKSVLVNSIYGHGQKNWTALAWLLERQYFSEYGLKQKMELTGDKGSPLTFVVRYEDKKVSPEKLERPIEQPKE